MRPSQVPQPLPFGSAARLAARGGRRRARAAARDPGHRRRQRRHGLDARRRAAPARVTRSTPAARRAGSASTRTERSRCRGCSSRRRRCPAAGSWAGRWPRPAPRSTGSATVSGGGWSTDELVAAAAAVPAGANGLVFLPYLAGERAPVFDEQARGAFVGLTLGHGRADLARAVLEAAAFSLRHVAEPLVEAGAPLRELRLAGRPSHDDTWARIKADVLGVPVAIPRDREHGGARRGDPRGGGQRAAPGPRGGGDGDDRRRPADRARPVGPCRVRRPVRGLPVALPGARARDARAGGVRARSSNSDAGGGTFRAEPSGQGAIPDRW